MPLENTYADANATYPVAPDHYDDVCRLLKEMDGNPSSIHARGRTAKVALETARGHVARLLGAKPLDVVFTSGATEANNMAIQGRLGLTPKPKPHVVVSAAEHSSVLETARVLEQRGVCELSIAPVTAAGIIQDEALLALVRPETSMVALIHGNNEVGAINPVQDIAPRIKERAKHCHVHTDAVQTLGKCDLTWLAASAIDSAAVSAHKIGGFKGVGALYMKSGTKLALFLAGGGQERGRRPGTENMPGILSFGLRCQKLAGQEAALAARMRAKRERLLAELKSLAGAVVHGPAHEALPNTVNFHVDGVAGDDILLNFDLAGIQASSGSACSSGSSRPSHVLEAMGLGEWVALNSVRISFAAEGDPAREVDHIMRTLTAVVARVRRSS